MPVWDTHLQGLAVTDSSIRAEPDMLLFDAYAEAANIVSVLEAKSTLIWTLIEANSTLIWTLIEANGHVDVAFQLGQRVEQLQRSQLKHSS